MGKQVITEADVVEAAEAGTKIIEAPLGECIVTYGARDKALSLGMEIHEASEQGDSSPSKIAYPSIWIPKSWKTWFGRWPLPIYPNLPPP